MQTALALIQVLLEAVMLAVVLYDRGKASGPPYGEPPKQNED